MILPTVGGQQWSERVTDMVIGFLTHFKPTEYNTANILTVLRLISLNNNIVGSLPSVDFVHKCWNFLAVETNNIGGYRISKASKVLKHHSDDAYRRGVSFGNSILKIATKARYENVALSSAIFAADGTAESRVAVIQRTFLEGRDLLQNWRDVTRRMFPDRHDLLDKLPG